MFHSLKILTPTIALLLLSNNLHAAIMTFDSLVNNGGVPSTYTESGITASGTISGYSTTGSVHLDDFGTPFSMSASFSMDSLFSAISFDVTDLNGDTFLNLGTAEGFRNGTLIASTSFSSTSIVNLPATFTGLDDFMITVTDHSELFLDTGCAPCNHINIDNITLAPSSLSPGFSPVPLPAGFPLMASALAGLSLFRRKKVE